MMEDNIESKNAEKKAIVKNKTFSYGESHHLNACIGRNSGINNWNGYSWGFLQAVEVMLSAVLTGVYRGISTGEEQAPNIDGLIYPICFCARHHIELFLKKEIAFISYMRGGDELIEEGHSLLCLWNKFENLCEIKDRRLSIRTKQMKEYIMDYAEVDSTGQVFRYAYSKENTEHLVNMGGVINL